MIHEVTLLAPITLKREEFNISKSKQVSEDVIEVSGAKKTLENGTMNSLIVEMFPSFKCVQMKSTFNNQGPKTMFSSVLQRK